MHVLITRPVDEAERTAQALRTSGFTPVVAPLFAVVTHTLPPLPPHEALILTSARALAALPPDYPRGLPVYTVGDRTAEAASAAGFSAVHSAGADAVALVTLIETMQPPSRLLYLAGQDRTADLAALLPHHAIVTLCAYEARALAVPDQEAARMLEAGTIEAVLHYSQRAARQFLALYGAKAGQTHLCLSAHVAKPLIAAGLATRLADAPTEAALLAALAGWRAGGVG